MNLTLDQFDVYIQLCNIMPPFKELQKKDAKN